MELRERIASSLCVASNKFMSTDPDDGEWMMYLGDADAVLAAIAAAGLVIVPREPSEAMIDAGYKPMTFEEPSEALPALVWTAMLAAAVARREGGLMGEQRAFADMSDYELRAIIVRYLKNPRGSGNSNVAGASEEIRRRALPRNSRFLRPPV